MKWRPFNTHAFLMQSRKWDDKKKRLEEELKELPELPAIENKTGVRSGKISDLTKQTAMKRIELEEKIKEIDHNKEMLEYGLSTLGEQERELIDGLYFSSRSNSAFVQEYGYKHAMCISYVYVKRKQILNDMGDKIIEKFYGGE